MAHFTGNQKLVFLEAVQQQGTLGAERAQLLGRVYDLETSQNVELKAAYYIIALRAEDTAAYSGTAKLLGQVGRMKFVRPLYRELNRVDRPIALATFDKNKDFYHPICRGMVEKDLGIKS